MRRRALCVRHDAVSDAVPGLSDAACLCHIGRSSGDGDSRSRCPRRRGVPTWRRPTPRSHPHLLSSLSFDGHSGASRCHCRCCSFAVSQPSQLLERHFSVVCSVERCFHLCRRSPRSTSLWTALVAGVLGAYLVSVSHSPLVSEEEILQRTIDTIPRELWTFARSAAGDAGTDPDLVSAVMAVENLQRPSWFRSLERWKGRIWPRGTYGIMQVASSRPLSDHESIVKALAERFAGVTVAHDGFEDAVDSGKIRAFALSYNPSSTYADLVFARLRDEAERTRCARTETSSLDVAQGTNAARSRASNWPRVGRARAYRDRCRRSYGAGSRARRSRRAAPPSPPRTHRSAEDGEGCLERRAAR